MKRFTSVQLMPCLFLLFVSLLSGQTMERPASDTLLKAMVLVEEGEFVMGNPPGPVQRSALPAHRVHVRSFYLDQYEVTVAQYREFCEATGREMPDQPLFSREHHPVVYVTWLDATAYAQWKAKRLPTEAEWEFAARGGNRSKRFKYSGGDSLAEVGWYLGNSGGQTHPVGQKRPNELGVYDMSGNAYEWCNDWFSETYYSNSPADNPIGPVSGDAKVIRGGCWYDGDIVGTRAANRGSFDPQDTFMYFGFRCACDPPAGR